MTPGDYASRAVPRYTSYPTAPHFTGQVGEAQYRDWLGALDPAEPISLYLHVPFCRELCWYCGCNMKLAKRQAPVAAYAETLRAEIALLSRALPGRMALSHIAWGGGTPTSLSPEDFAALMAELRAHFDLRDGAEIAVEADPRHLSEAMMDALAANGVTRASFGVQEFDPAVQRAINRIQPPQMVARAVQGLRQRGIAGINFDLIYGLPHQTTATLLSTIDEALAMAPDRIALFGYAHVPWMAKKQRLIDENALPGGEARAEMAEAAAQALVAAGYQAIGIDHFALPGDPLAIAAREGRLRRNFQGYTTDTAPALLGLGSTAIGRTPGGYVQNSHATGIWSTEVAAGRLPVTRGIALSAEDHLRGAAIERIMCQGAVDLGQMGRAAGLPADWWRDAAPELEEMAHGGLALIEGDHLTLTDTGRPLARVVASAFDAYLPRGAARHSVAV